MHILALQAQLEGRDGCGDTDPRFQDQHDDQPSQQPQTKKQPTSS